MDEQEEAVREDQALQRIRADVPAEVTHPLSVEGLIAKAIEHGVSVEGLEKLLAMRERLRAEEAKAAFYAALSAFQAECPVIEKRKTVSGANFNYKYAPLEDIVRTVQPLLFKHGLSYSFDTMFETSPPAMRVECTVTHTAGHQEHSEFRTPVDGGAGRMNEMQRSAAAQTYGKRYALCNVLGILTGDEDNDGRTPPQGGGGSDQRPATWTPRTPPRSPSPNPAAGVDRGQTGPAEPAVAGGGADDTPPPIGRNLKILRRDIPTLPNSPGHELSALRMEAIEKHIPLTRDFPKYKDLDDSEAWSKSEELLNAACGVNFKGKSLLDLNLNELHQVHRKLDLKLEEKHKAREAAKMDQELGKDRA